MIEKSRKEGGREIRMGRIGDRPYWVLNLSILIRAVHLVGAAVVLSSFLLAGVVRPPTHYAVIAYASGVALLIAEGIRHRQIYRELAGVSTFVKLLLLGAAYHGLVPPRETLLLIFILASIAAHAPKQVRHRLLL
ncbi:MAG: hypothetical protein OEL83_13600 [Desulforhopalus sp.]|nr:hypothetical protein [Desulforhopalus sp.]